jgi:hypothetical protein
MTSFKIITLGASFLFGAVWTYLSVRNGVMYTPPGEISAFMVALISGKIVQSHIESKQ